MCPNSMRSHRSERSANDPADKSDDPQHVVFDPDRPAHSPRDDWKSPCPCMIRPQQEKVPNYSGAETIVRYSAENDAVTE